jgi:hypothetical protein
MKWIRPVVSPILLLTLLVGAAHLEGEAHGQKKKKGPPPKAKVPEVDDSDPRLKSIRGDLEAVFRHWDVDKDKKVTAAELARGLRGDDAVPYRPASPGEAKKPGSQPTKLADIVKKYPDYNFMLHWDKDRDDDLTEKEFEAFVTEVSAHYKVVFEKQDQLERLQKRIAVKEIDGSRAARLKAQMRVLGTELGMAREGFRHQLDLDFIAKRQALNRTNWAWYKAAGKR